MKSALIVRSWEGGDVERVRIFGAHLSPRTLRSRFWQGVSGVPEPYLASIAHRWPRDWDAVVAVRDGCVIGWAEYARNAPGSNDADAAFVVADAEQGHGVGTALLHALLARAMRSGVTAVHADIAAANTPAVRAWHTATAGFPTTGTVGPDGYRLTVLPAAHPAQAA